MGKGRPRTPIEKMAARSPDGRTPGHRNLPATRSRSVPDRSVPALPRDVPEDSRGAQEWERIWVAGFWLHRDQDYHWVEMIARAYNAIDSFREAIGDQLTVQGYKNDLILAHPLLKEITTQQQLIMKCLSVLGFSPTDRAKLDLTSAKAQSALQEAIKGHRDSLRR
jgi:phage terminase small subunit